MPRNRTEPVTKTLDKIQLNCPDGFHSTENTKAAVCRAQHSLNAQNKAKTIHKWNVQMLNQLYFCSSRNAIQSVQSCSSRAPVFLLRRVLCRLLKSHQMKCTQFLIPSLISPIQKMGTTFPSELPKPSVPYSTAWSQTAPTERLLYLGWVCKQPNLALPKSTAWYCSTSIQGIAITQLELKRCESLCHKREVKTTIETIIKRLKTITKTDTVTFCIVLLYKPGLPQCKGIKWQMRSTHPVMVWQHPKSFNSNSRTSFRDRHFCPQHHHEAAPLPPRCSQGAEVPRSSVTHRTGTPASVGPAAPGTALCGKHQKLC